MRRQDDDVADASELGGSRDPWPPDWTPARVIATLEPLVGYERRARLQGVLAERVGSVAVLMDSPHDPHNTAAVLRSCDAFGLTELHVALGDESFLLVRKISKGTERWVDVVTHPTPAAAAGALRARGFELLAAHPEGELTPEDLELVPRPALMLGREHDGLRPELAAFASRRVRVPMRGFVESLNVSVSAAVLLAAATRRRAGDLPAAERERWYAKGLYRSVSRAEEILRARAGGDSKPTGSG